MQFKRSLSAALALALTGSGNFAMANALDDRSGARQALAMAIPNKGSKSMNETIASHAKTDRERDHKRGHEKNPQTPLVEKYLLEGKLADGESALNDRLKDHAKDDQARFGLGMLQFLSAIEHLGQDLHRYGVRDFSKRGVAVPILRLPVPNNPDPQQITYQQLRTIAETFRLRLVEAESNLALITEAEVKLPLHFGMIRLDSNGDGHAGDDESLWKVYSQMTNNTSIPLETAKDFFIKFDRGDVHWLRGYCHLLSSLCDMYLAYDSSETFGVAAHVFFKKVDTPSEFLTRAKPFHPIGENHLEILDLIALVHTIRWPVVEPKRLEAALNHLQAVIVQSRETWKWIMAETDDDHEWLPNPRQTGVIPNVRVTDAMVTSWAEIMNESEKILSGKLLIPFWRSSDGDGINLRKVFLEPRTFDLILWVQGSAAAPYVEKGELTKGETWRRLQGDFGHNFPGFALWFN